MFNNFLNNNNSPVNKNTQKRALNTQPFLTNNNINAFKKRINANNSKAFNDALKLASNRTIKLSVPISELKLGFFNSMVNPEYDKTIRLSLIAIFDKDIVSPSIVSGYKIEVLSTKLYYGQFRVGAERNKKGVFGKIDDSKNYFMIQLAAEISKGAEKRAITFRLYKHGKIHFSGGFINNDVNVPEIVRKYIVDNYTNKNRFLYNKIVFNNTVGQFDVNGIVDLSKIASTFNKKYKVEYEPELRAGLKLVYNNTIYQLWRSGVVQIVGIRDIKDMQPAYLNGISLMSEFESFNFLKLSTTPKKVKKSKKVKVVNNNTKSLNTEKLSYEKTCMKYKKPMLVEVAKSMGIVNIKSTTSKQKICALIREQLTKPKPAVKPSKPVNAPPSPVPTPVTPKEVKDKRIKRRLTNNLIRENIFKLHGKVTNADVEAVRKLLNDPKVKRNKSGVPFKGDANAIKRKYMVLPSPVKNMPNTNNNNNNNFLKELENVMNVAKIDPSKYDKRRLTNKLIKENLLKLDKNVVSFTLNKNVEEVKRRIADNKTIKRNKNGVPFKSGANAIKKKFINQMRKERAALKNVVTEEI